jgi:hypothetical protein
MLQKSGTPAAYVSVEIRDLSGGPGNLILAGRSLPASSIPTTAGFVTVNFSPAAPVTAGTQYAIVAYSSAAPSSYLWFVSPDDSYAGGNPFFSASPPSTWTSTTVDDQTFRTYVTPSPATGPTGRRAAALKKCKHSRDKKKRKKCRKKANRLPV